jgi:hypothetical protein
VYKENGGPANVIQCQPVEANARVRSRYVLNIQVFTSCYEASLNETIAIFCADCTPLSQAMGKYSDNMMAERVRTGMYRYIPVI